MQITQFHSLKSRQLQKISTSRDKKTLISGHPPHPCGDHRHREDRVPGEGHDLPHVRRRRPEVGEEEVDPLLRQRHRRPLHRVTLRV